MPGTKRKGKGDAWYFEVTIGTDFSGKPIRYNRTFHGTEKQAEKALARFYTECEDGRARKESSATVSQMCGEVMDSLTLTLKKNTIRGYKSCKTRIDEGIGNRKAAKLTPKNIQGWINNMVESGLSPKTIRNTYSFLRMCYETYGQWDIIPASPCHHVKLPKKDNRESRYYTAGEVNMLLASLNRTGKDEINLKAAILIQLFGGLRKGEALGLNWEDIDMDTGVINVHRSRYIEKGGGIYEDTPKSDKSNRLVTLPQEIITELEALKTYQLEQKLKLPGKYASSPAVIQNEFGAPLRPEYLYEWFKAFSKKHDLPWVGLHGLRHTHASMLAYMGAEAVQVSTRLGHSQLSTTLNIYTHLFHNRDKDLADDLSGIFTKTK